MLEKMELDETGFPQPTGETEELEADSLVLALGQEADLSLLDGVPGLEIEDGVVQVDRAHDDRPRGHLRRRRHGARRAHRHRRRRPRQAGRAQHRRVAARRAEYAHPPEPELASFEQLNTWYYADAPKTVAPQLDAIRRQSTFDEVTLGPGRDQRAVRGAPLPVVRQLLRLRQLLRRVPRQRGPQGRRGRRLRVRPRLLQGLRHLRRRSARAARSR